jgi:hypothetical protein
MLGSEGVGKLLVGVERRSAQNDHGYGSKLLILTDRDQNLPAINPGKIQVQENCAGTLYARKHSSPS